MRGRWVKYPMVLLWLVVVAAAAPLAGKLTGIQRNDARNYLPASAESTRALDIQARFGSPDVLPAAGPDVSADGASAQVGIPFNFGAEAWAKAPGAVDAIRAIATGGGLAAHVTGPVGSTADVSRAFTGIDSTLLYATVAIVVLILLLTYRSPTLWLLPVISAGVALTAAQAVIYLLAKHSGLVVSSQSTGILTVLVFGAGTDYALLIVARYREELRRHADRHAAMAVALRRASPALVASAATVAAGMLCLVAADSNATSGMGPVAAIGVVVTLAVTLTLLPALLVTVGRWVFWPVRPRYGSAEPSATGMWARAGAVIARRPRAVWLVTSLALGTVALGVFQLDATGLTDKESFRTTPDSVVGEAVLAAHFPATSGGQPVVIVSRSGAAAGVRAALAGTPGIDAASVPAPVVDGDWAYLEGTLTAPVDSAAAFDTIDRVRARVHAVPGADARVGGRTATNLDLRRAAGRDQALIIPLVLAVVLVILALLLRAVVAPLLLIATVVLSFGAALGASALMFRYVFGFGGAGSSLPLFVFVFLVALGIDYNIFLMTRVRDEARVHGTRRAALVGLTATGGVITSAGLVLAGTFAMLFTLPVTEFAEIGFAVALGVLLDTVVVRAVLVTALTLDLGPAIWWPGRPSRRGNLTLGGGNTRGETVDPLVPAP